MHQNKSRFIEINLQECEVDGLSTDVLYKADTLHDLNKEFRGRTVHLVSFYYILSIWYDMDHPQNTTANSSFVVIYVFVVTGVCYQALA
jgi:hypothetical protein